MDLSDNYCPHCKKYTFLITNTREGTIECSVCGLVIEDHLIDETEEIRRFSKESDSGADRSRTGGIRNDSLADGGLSLSVLGNASNRMTSDIMAMTNRMGSEDRSFLRGRKLISQWGSLLNLQKSILTKAEEQFLRVEKNSKSFKGRSIESIVAAVLYVASRISSIPLKPHDIENATGVSIKDIKSAYRAVKEHMAYIPPLDPPRYCSNFCAKLGLPPEVSSTAYKIAENIKNKRLLDGRNPRTIAATAIHMAVQQNPNVTCSLQSISEHSKIAENTIKNSYKDILPFRQDLLPDGKV